MDGWLATIENVSVVILLCASVVLYFSQVVTRYLIGFTFAWAEETIVAMVVWACFIGASIAVRHHAHIRLDLLLRVLPSVVQRPVAIVALLLSIVFVALMFWWGVEFVQFMAFTNNRAESIDIPAYPFYIAVPLGGGLMTIRFIQELWRTLQPDWHPSHEEGEGTP